MLLRMTLSLIGKVTPSFRSFRFTVRSAEFINGIVNGALSVRMRPFPFTPGYISLTYERAKSMIVSSVGNPDCWVFVIFYLRKTATVGPAAGRLANLIGLNTV